MAVIQRVGSPAKPRKWMSVHEMGDMLGLKKTDRYWLVHKNYFRTETLLGKMRVEIASFEKWYANQDWYHKVNGEAPGKELRLRSYSPKEIQEMLGTDNATVYEILKKNNIETVTVNERMRVPTDSTQLTSAIYNRPIADLAPFFLHRHPPGSLVILFHHNL